MTVEEGIKMIISGGIVTPPDRRSDEQKQIKRVASSTGDRPTIGPGSEMADVPPIPEKVDTSEDGGDKKDA
jgi:hypothetical protein